MKFMKKFIAMALVIVSVLSLAVSAFAETMYTYNFPTDQIVFLRSARSTSSSYVATVPYGEKVDASDLRSGWYRVTWNGKTGYMMDDYLTTENPLEAGWKDRYGTLVFVRSNSRKTGVAEYQSDLNYYFNTVNPDAQPADWKSLVVDGIYGNKSVLATTAFQKLFDDLDNDGKAGPLTKAKLYGLTGGNH